jgi:hypothetical protein
VVCLPPSWQLREVSSGLGEKFLQLRHAVEELAESHVHMQITLKKNDSIAAKVTLVAIGLLITALFLLSSEPYSSPSTQTTQCPRDLGP